MTLGSDPRDDPRQLEAWAGEARANVVRLAAILLFYGNHLLGFFVSGEASLTIQQHARLTTLAALWAVAVLVTHVLLRRGLPPPWLKYFVTSWDVAMITLMLAYSGGPDNTLIVLYLLVLAAAPLRISLPLVRYATIICMLGYLAALGHHVFFVIGADLYYADAALRIPRSQQIIVLLSILFCGVLAGQVTRQLERNTRRTRTATASEAG